MKNKPSKIGFKGWKIGIRYYSIQLINAAAIGLIIALILGIKPFAAYGNPFKRIGRLTGVNYKILVSVAYVESGLNPYAVDVDGRAYFFKDKRNAVRAVKRYISEYQSVDIGLMQVNYEIWGRYLNLPVSLLFNPKINILIGAYILSHYIKKYGYSWKTIGRYHSARSWSNYNYRRKIQYIYGLIGKNK